ncbi:MAG: serine/threonine protein kinase, partial [Myxococcales bacterium]|nr:serine/threonine protein kinase [Myxococcales bacterium]
MGIWERLFRRKGKEEEHEPPPAEGEAEVDEPFEDEEEHRQLAKQDKAAREAAAARQEELLRLGRVGREGGYEVDDAIAILRAHEGRPEQTEDLRALVEALGQVGAEAGHLDPVRVACASLLDDRGRRREARELVSVARSVEGMMLAAELHAAMGELPKAVSMVERVLARAIDTPGAQERHEQWSAQLGRRPRAELAEAQATVVAPTGGKAATFRIRREVARGGAGVVYEAEDELLGRRLAYKVYHRGADDHDQVEREARYAVRLAGPGVIRVFDADPSQGWLACEWLPEGSLRDLLQDTSDPERVASLFPLAAWFPQVIAAVARVHAEGLVHSDLKPHNLLFRAPDDPVLADFGTCRTTGHEGIAGTPGYMSPERLAGDPADPRDDVYALGRILEDILGVRDDATLPPDVVAATEPDARRWAKIALACLAEANSRPA